MMQQQMLNFWAFGCFRLMVGQAARRRAEARTGTCTRTGTRTCAGCGWLLAVF